jgi:putative holliday junction resolvase
MKGKVLAIDYGSKRVGFASGDLEMKITFPREVVENKSHGFLVDWVEKFVDEWGVTMIVVGKPLNMEEGHQENPIMKAIEGFSSMLAKRFPELEIIMFDERLSSFEADALMARDGKGEKDRKQNRDAYAAQVILERYFNSL